MNVTLTDHVFEPIPAVAPTRNQILAMEQVMVSMRDAGMPMIDGEARTEHYFAPGLYARQFDMKAGDRVIGKIHRHQHLAMLVCGRARIADEHQVVDMEGPCVFTSPPEVKRVVYAFTDCRFMTFHPTTETNLAKIEAEVIAPSYEEFDGGPSA